MPKIGKSAFPANHTANDFKAFGPVVTKDTEWGDCRLADLGCFKQESVDSNKYYHLSVVQSTKDINKWFAYFEWGRTRPDGRPDKPSFQFTECSSEIEAIDVCRKQFNEKNTKRGVWEKVGSKERFVSKPGKDAYIVRPTATRMVGLPCAENIANENAKGQTSKVVEVKSVSKVSKVDFETKKLFRDLIGGTIKYANAVMSGGSGKATLPTQDAITDAREILQDAMLRIKYVGNDIQSQLTDSELKKLTYGLYGMIPKSKPIGAAESSWLLTQDNIALWKLDLDALETALQGNEIKIEREDTDVMEGIPANIYHIPQSDSTYQWLVPWWTSATRNKHANVGNIKILNLWGIERHGDRNVLRESQQSIAKEMPSNWNKERPLHQMNDRPDLNASERKLFFNTNTAMVFHGSRSCNIYGIVKESFRFPSELVGVTINGAAIGPGTYMADDVKKSCGYCSHSRANWVSGGGIQGRHSFMFVCDVVYGNSYMAPECYGYSKPPSGYHSVFAKGGYTKTTWKSAMLASNGKLANNEWVVYQKGRIEIRYLAEITW